MYLRTFALLFSTAMLAQPGAAQDVGLPYSSERSAPTVAVFGPGGDVWQKPVLDASTQRLYLFKQGGSYLTVVDARTDAVIRTVGVPDGGRVYGVAVDAEHHRLYVGGTVCTAPNQYGGCDFPISMEGRLWIFDTAAAEETLAPAALNPIPLHALATGPLAVNSNTDLVYVSSVSLSPSSGCSGCVAYSVLVVDPMSSAPVVAQISTTNNVSDLLADPTTNRIYVAQWGRTPILTINGDPNGGSLADILGTFDGGSVRDLDLDVRNQRLYASSSVGDSSPQWWGVTIFDTTGTPYLAEPPTATIEPVMGYFPASYAVTINPNTAIVYVLFVDDIGSFNGGGVVSAYDARTGTVLSHTLLRPGDYWDRYGFVHLTSNPATNRVYVTGQGNVGEVLQDRGEISVAVDPSGVADTGGVSVQFPDGVVGDLTVTTINPESESPSLPGQFSIQGALAYEISLDPALPSTLTGPINVCFAAASVNDPDVFAALTVFHRVSGVWREETDVTYRDYATGWICVNVTTLSPFILATRHSEYIVQSLFDSTKSIRAGRTLPIKIALRSSTGANLSSAAIGVRPKGIKKISDGATTAIQDAGQANADTTFRYDASLGGYIFNLRSDGLSNGTYDLTVKAGGDVREHIVRFQVRGS